MALFGKKPSGSDRTPMTVYILESHQDIVGDDGGPGLLGMGWEATVGIPFHFLLEIRPSDGSPAYQIEHDTRIKSGVLWTGFLEGERKIPAGIELPGTVNPADPTDITIDWKAYRSSPDAKAASDAAHYAEEDLKYAQYLLPKQSAKAQEQLRSSALMSLQMLTEMVRAGQVPRDQFQTEADMNLRRTLITQEQYDTAMARIAEA